MDGFLGQLPYSGRLTHDLPATRLQGGTSGKWFKLGETTLEVTQGVNIPQMPPDSGGIGMGVD